MKSLWDAIKRSERATRAAADSKAGVNGERPGLLSEVPLALPALTRAAKLSRKAASVGFDWSDSAQVAAKIREELDEVEEAIRQGSKAAVEDEIGDLLFAVTNLARYLEVDPEKALRGANAKFQRRFGAIEAALAEQGRGLEDSDPEEMEGLWAKAKHAERKAGSC